jgi:hypothetical protein
LDNRFRVGSHEKIDRVDPGWSKLITGRSSPWTTRSKNSRVGFAEVLCASNPTGVSRRARARIYFIVAFSAIFRRSGP